MSQPNPVGPIRQADLPWQGRRNHNWSRKGSWGEATLVAGFPDSNPTAHFAGLEGTADLSTTNRSAGKHRKAGLKKTPLTELAANVTGNAGNVGRRSAVLAASSGLVMTMGLPAAQANTVTPESPSTDAAQAMPEEPEAPPISAPADAEVDFSGTTLTAGKPAPAPEPQTETDERTAERRASAESRATRDNANRAPSQTTNRTPSASSAPSSTPAKKPVSKPAKAPAKKPAAAPSGPKAQQVISIAKRYTGVPYRWGGTTPAGFDCSGFTQYVYRQVGVSLPRTSGAQAGAGTRVSKAAARPGDLVWKSGHVGIYLGNGMMIDAPSTGKSISVRKVYFMSSARFTRVL